MKKLYVSFLGLAAATVTNAQTITSTNIPVVGDVYNYYNMDTTNVLPGSAGTAQTWNFSTIPALQPMGGTTYVTVASTPKAADFPSSTFAQNDSSNYTYYRFVGNVYQNDGLDQTLAGQSVECIFSDPGVIFSTLPINMSYTNGGDAISGTVNSSVGNGTCTGTITTLADGTGTLILPSGTFNNVLRVKMDLALSISLLGGLITADITETRYMWFNTASKFPLFQTGTTGQSSSLGASSTTRFASMNSVGYVGVKENQNAVSFNIFPSPAKNDVNVKMNFGKQTSCSIEIINQLGQVVRSENIDNQNAGTVNKKFNLAGIASGIYFVRVRNAEFTKVQKFIVE